MEGLKKLFGETNLSYKKIVVLAFVIGIYVAAMAMIPIVQDTSFSDLKVTFEVWILFGIIIIMNSKSAKESALKCFIFFLISQPIIYLLQDLFKHTTLFKTYYLYWFLWTIGTLPMGFIGYYMKKDKWWGLIILTPILILLGLQYNMYLSLTMFSFPRHLLTTLFCIASAIIYPLCIFSGKKVKITGIIISLSILVVMTVICIINPPLYSTDIIGNGEEYHFDDTYKVYLVDKKYGDLSIRYEPGLDDWMVHAEFKKAGKTEFVLESPDGEKETYEITIKRDSYKVNKK